jgi:hypothetical protein
MFTPSHEEERLRELLNASAAAPQAANRMIRSVLRRAHTRIGVRNVLSLLFGRMWLALAALLAPLVLRFHHHLMDLGQTRRK